MHEYLPTLAVLVVAAAGALLNWGAFGARLNALDTKSVQVDATDSRQDRELKVHGEHLAKIDGELKCPLSGCPMQLTVRARANAAPADGGGS